EQLVIQGLEIADLKKQMQFLYQRVESSDLSDGIATFDPMSDRPPHY
ncbi:MAG: SlyX protein, partial [Acinetobacter sp.]